MHLLLTPGGVNKREGAPYGRLADIYVQKRRHWCMYWTGVIAPVGCGIYAAAECNSHLLLQV